MKMHEGVEVQLHIFLNSTTDGGKASENVQLSCNTSQAYTVLLEISITSEYYINNKHFV